MVLDPCPKCGGASKTAPNLDPPFGFCSKCLWFTHAYNDEHNAMLINISSNIGSIQELIESAQKDVDEEFGWSVRTRQIARKFVNLLKQMRKEGVR